MGAARYEKIPALLSCVNPFKSTATSIPMRLDKLATSISDRFATSKNWSKEAVTLFRISYFLAGPNEKAMSSNLFLL
jgi:hypothetical protein